MATTASARITHRQMAESDGNFRRLCLAAGIEPTKRHAAKYRHRRGQAWTWEKTHTSARTHA